MRRIPCSTSRPFSFSWWRRLFPSIAPAAKAVRWRRPGLERLEDRTVLSGQTVDVGGLRFCFLGSVNQQGGIYSTSGDVQLGFPPDGGESFLALVDIDGGLSLDTAALNFSLNAGADVHAIVFAGEPSIDLFRIDSALDINIPTLLNQGLTQLEGKSLDVAGVDFTLDAVKLVNPNGGSTADAQIQLQGAVSISVLSNLKIAVDEQNYVAIDTSGVSLTGVAGSVNADFTVAGVTLTGDLDVQYSTTNDQFILSGNATVSTIDSGLSQIRVSLGDAANPGIIVQDGTLQQFVLGLTSDIEVFGLSITTDDLTFAYQRANDTFAMYGGVTVQVDGNEIDASFGDEDTPGLVIGSTGIQSVAFGLSGHIQIFALDLTARGLTFDYDASTRAYEIYGELGVSVLGDSVQADLGTASDPGLEIINGSITHIHIGINTDFNILGLTFQIPEQDPVTVVYNSNGATNEYDITGTVTVQEIFNARVTLGVDGEKGIHIIDGQVDVDSFQLDLKDVQLGAFTLQELVVTYTSNEIDIDVQVLFPLGWSVGGSIELVNGRINEIRVDYMVTGEEEGIALGDTGLFVTEISARLQNLMQPADLVVSGSLAVAFAGQVTVGSRALSIFRAEGDFLVNKDQLVLKADVDLLAYESNGTWEGLLGDGQGQLTLDWGQGIYKLDVQADLFYDIFQIDASITFDNKGDLSLLATADLQIPKSIPLVGGKEIAGVGFAMEIINGSPKKSYVAAWFEIHVLTRFDIGIEFKDFTNLSGNIGNDLKHLELIGTKQVNQLKNEASSSGKTQYTYPYTFTMPDGATTATLQVEWPTSGGNQSVSLVVPGLNNNQPILQKDFSKYPNIVVSPVLNTSSKQLTVYLSGSATDPNVALPSGTYTLNFIVDGLSHPYAEAPTFTWTSTVVQPTIAVVQPASFPVGNTVTLTVNGTASSDLLSSSQATVTVYMDTDAGGYNGKPIATALTPADAGGGNWQLDNVIWDLTGLDPTSYYLYAMIKDGVNAPVYSNYTAAITPTPPISGQLLDVAHGNAPLSGLVVQLQNADGSVRQSTTTNLDGYYSFYDSSLQVGSPYQLVALLPLGFQLDPGTANHSTTFAFSWQANPLRHDYALNQLTTIRGTVFDDVNQDGTFNAPDIGLEGFVVYLDLNNNGTLDPDDPTALTRGPNLSPQAGTYNFYNVQPGTYTVRLAPQDGFTPTGPAPSFRYTVTVDSGDTFTLFGGRDFGVLPYLTFTGQAQSYAVVHGQLSQTLSPVPGATVMLTTIVNGQKVVVDSTVTDAQGNYTLGAGKALPPAGATTTQVYSVVLSAPTGYRILSPDQAVIGFSAPTTVTGDMPADQVVTGDFNDDGKVDYAIMGLGNTVEVWTGNGAGAFTLAGTWTYSLGVSRLASFDDQGDGTDNLAIFYVQSAGSTSQTVQVSVLNWDGTAFSTKDTPGWQFSMPNGWVLSNPVCYSFDPPTPLNQLAIWIAPTREGASVVYLLIGDDQGGYSARPVDAPLYQLASGSVATLAAADINGDGLLDLVLSGTQNEGGIPSSAYAILLSNGENDFGPIGSLSSGLFGGPLALGDIDGDGQVDLTQSQVGSTNLSYAYNDGFSPYYLSEVQFVPTAQLAITRQMLLDVDGDLQLDLIVFGEMANGAGILQIFQNTGSAPNFNQATWTQTFASAPHDIAVADVNADGKPDLFLAFEGSNSLTLLLNTSEDVIASFFVPVSSNDQIQGITAYTGFDFVLSQFNDFALSDPDTPGQIGGIVFDDANHNGIRDPGEKGSEGITVYLDRNQDGVLNGDEPATTTNAHGAYQFSRLGDGLYTVRLMVEPGQTVTTTEAARHFRVVAGVPRLVRNPDVGVATNALPQIVLRSGAGASENGQAFQLTGTYTDLDGVGIVSALVNWGDGSNDYLLLRRNRRGGTFSASHVYTDGGAYTVTVTLVGEDRSMASATTSASVIGAGMHDGILQVFGTDGDDVVHISHLPQGGAVVTASFLGRRTKTFDNLTQVRLFAGAGNDRVVIEGGRGTGTWIFGEDGNDELIGSAGDDRIDGGAGVDLLAGGQGNDLLRGGDGDDVLRGEAGDDILVGGNGNDTLLGGDGRDLLLGGLGADRIFGQASEDLLVAGICVHESSMAALHAILAEWTSTRSYAERIRNLTQGGAAGNNGAFFLDSRSVHDDGAADKLFGGLGRDWFLVFPLDRLEDREANEQVGW